MNVKSYRQTQDADPEETSEWLESLHAVIEREGLTRAHYLLEQMVDFTRRSGGYLPYDATTAYINTIPPSQSAKHPGDYETERRIRSFIRWNAMAIVQRAGKRGGELGGHIASFASAASLYDVGFNHFFRGPDAEGGGDLVYIQGHSSPGIYARAFLEGRISAEQLDNFRQEVDGHGLSSYPHPWLMPDFWQLPTVSMGLGPIMAIYQARFLKYLHNRGIADTSNRRVWCFLGDGETDEPESLGAISLAGREGLGNLIFVVNCNLQRLDGPVRGNGKIIQELEGVFHGAGWDVLKVIWGSRWDALLAKDKDGLLRKRMEEAVDGEYQNYKAKGGAFTREHFFGAYPELKEMVANMSDEDVWRLNRGGHDSHKIYSAYHAAVQYEVHPTVILAKTVKGCGMGKSGEAQNISHQQKKMDADSIRQFRDRFNVPITDDEIADVPYYHPGEDSPEVKYMKERRAALGGYLPQRRVQSNPLTVPELEAFESLLKDTGEREISTTMTFVRTLAIMLRDKNIAKHIVPIVADEARTFGMEGMFRQLGIYSSKGQLYTPMDSDQLMFYKEDTKGQILQEGITEAGAMSSWIAAATSYANNGVPMIPFFIVYSMFGFQRVGDLAWAAGDMRARGFLIGGTSGRTTLNGEGLQHEDGNSHVMSGLVPNCVSYDPTFAYELAVILQDGLRRMYQEQEDVYYYITVLNENYTHPAMPDGVEEGIRKGLYCLHEGGDEGLRVQLMGSGAILREVMAAAEILEYDYGVNATIWSATSFTELHRDGADVGRYNRLNPEAEPRTCWVSQCLEGQEGPVVAATDYVRTFAEQIRPYLPECNYTVLGTDGFGRSDTRENLRRFFEVDRKSIVYAALHALCQQGSIPVHELVKARDSLGLDPPNPTRWECKAVSNRIEITVPDIGDFGDVPVIEVLVAAGDTVEAEQSLVTLESDKATMEVPAPVAGVIVELRVQLDDTVSEGDIVAVIDAADEVASSDPVATEQSAPEPEVKQSKAPVSAPSAPSAKVTSPAPPSTGSRQSPPVPMDANAALPSSAPYASPAIRRFARELGTDLARVTGSAKGGRIIREDVTAFVKSIMSDAAAPASGGLVFDLPPPPKVNFSRYGEIELQPLTRIQKISGAYLHRNWLSIPHVTQNDLADITDMETYRKANAEKAREQGFKLTPLVFMIKAAVAALREFPVFNASLDESRENLVLKKFFHIGIAVDTPDGLVVPVIRDCDQKDVFQLAGELGELSQKARDGKLKPTEMQGGCFSISSLGGIGGTSFTPIINAPEVAILGVSRSSISPQWDGEAFQPRMMLPLSLSYDHRVIDGANAARFARFLAVSLEKFESMDL